MDSYVLIAFLVCLFAGLATAVGASLGLFAKHTNRSFLGVALGFSAGVMIYVSFVEILPKAEDFLRIDGGNFSGALLVTISFMGGLIGMAILYRLLPDLEHPQLSDPKTRLPGEEGPALVTDKLLFRAGLLVALAITFHNFPEGMATFFLTLTDPQVGLTVGLAIAIHNIPEGIAVAVPVYYATRNRKVAFGFGALSGLAEPLGAIIGYSILRPFISDPVLGVIFAAVAGIMVYISIDSLLPAARKYGKPQFAVYGLIGGMAVMALSLVLLEVQL